ncbi:MFS transporter [Streptomyces oceani]|uniref:MFS transporter n=1 Tax=Streptomyces oceani TaxID=1075402 RepID=A0A1E7KKX6_9ACTN|nr:MFS transporter [Streptomyces oceani]OEV04578.1 MFS transporter [Streptomyces oceani]
MALNLDPAHGTVPKRRLFGVLALIILFSEIATFEVLMVYPALPSMAREFETVHIAWVASILTLAGATVMPLVGKAADKWGKKRIIVLLGLVFIVGSVVCALATSLPMMLLGRALQGCLVGVVTMSYSLVRDIMPRDFVPIALGMVVTGVGMSGIAGPFLAGWLLDDFGVDGIFWFLALYVTVLLPVFGMLVPESPVRATQPIDFLGTALLGPGIGILLLGVTQGTDWGWTAGSTLFLVFLGSGMLIGFVYWQRVCRNPLIDLDVLMGRRFGPTILAVSCVAYVMNAHAFIAPTMLMTWPEIPGISYGAGLSALEYALWTCPMGIAGMFVGPLGGYLSKRIGARQVLLAAGVLFILAMYLGTQLFTVYWQVAVLSFTVGCAVGCLHSSNANLVQDALPDSQSGVGNSIGGMAALLTAGVSTAITGAIVSNDVVPAEPGSDTMVYTDNALVNGYTYAAAVGVVGVVVALVMRHGREPARGGLAEPDVPSVEDEPRLSPAESAS